MHDVDVEGLGVGIEHSPAGAARHLDRGAHRAGVEVDHRQGVGAWHRWIADIGGQHQPALRVIGEAVGPHADGDLRHLRVGPGREHPDRVLAAIGGEDELAFVAHKRACDRGQVRHREEMPTRDRIEHVDRIVGGVGDVDVATSRVDRGMIEAAAAGMGRQIDMAEQV